MVKQKRVVVTLELAMQIKQLVTEGWSPKYATRLATGRSNDKYMILIKDMFPELHKEILEIAKKRVYERRGKI